MKSKTLDNVKRVIFVGDLHGCYEETIKLLDKCQATTDDTIVFTGDLVDRGLYPVECVELAMKNHCILGNHEHKHLSYRSTNRSLDTMPPHHATTQNLLGEKHWKYIEELPLYINIPQYNVVVVHAGVWPGISVEDQDINHLLNLQCVNEGPTNKSSWPSKSKPNTFWTNYYKGPSIIVFGHTGLNVPIKDEFVVGIDTGCVFGRDLTAYILPDDRLVQVRAKKQYYGRTKHPTLGDTDWSKLIRVHGDACTYS